MAGGLQQLNGAQGDDREHKCSVLMLGGPAKLLLGLVGLLSRSGPPLPSIFYCYLVSRCADPVAWDLARVIPSFPIPHEVGIEGIHSPFRLRRGE